MTQSDAAPATAAPKPSLKEVLLNRRMLICIFTGFSSGLPLYLLFNLVPAWLKTEGMDLKTIGAFALVQFPYTWKFIWSPLLDRFGLPQFGRRRTWMLTSQIALLLVIGALGFLSPQIDLSVIVLLAVLLAFLSATQDIALDAYRRELLRDAELGIGNTIHINAYRVSGLVPGSLALILADHMAWRSVFLITAVFMVPGIIMTLLVSEPTAAATAPRTLREAVVEPFRELWGRHGWRWALLILFFIFVYKLGDSMCTALATPFYLDMGYSKSAIGVVAKNAGLWPHVAGGLIGGAAMVKLGINRALWIFGVAQAAAILGFAALAARGAHTDTSPADLAALAFVIGFEAFGVGLGTAALVAFISKCTSPQYAATQFALFTSLSAVPRTFVNATTGVMVENLGWFTFFVVCAVCAIPGMLLLLKIAPWSDEQPATAQT